MLSFGFFLCGFFSIFGECPPSSPTISSPTNSPSSVVVATATIQQQQNVFDNQTILHIGDSQVAGMFGYHLGRNIIRNSENSVYIRRGKVGKGIRWWLTNRRLHRLIQQAQPDIILITLGGNDIWQAKNNPQEYDNLIHQFIQTIQPYQFVWITPPVSLGRNGHLQPLRNVVTEMLIKHLQPLGSEHFIDTRTLNSTYDLNNRNSDGLHYTFLGGKRWADEIMEQLERNLLNQNE